MEDMSGVKYIEKPNLKNPNLVCGFSGWVDGGESATGTIQYFKKKLGATGFAEIPIDNYRVFQMPGEEFLRPEVKIENGILKNHHIPKNEFLYAVTGGNNDIILFSGIEPNFNWGEYSEIFVKVIKEFSVKRVYLLGGVLGVIPYTKEPNVSCVCSPPALLVEMKKYNVQLASYEGPGSFGTTLIDQCQKRNIQVISLMAVAPYYPEYNISISRSSTSIRALVKRLNRLLNLNLNLADLDAEATDMEGKLDFVANQNPEFKEYIAKLEKEYVELKYEEPLEISADEAIRIAEELLKNKEP